MVARAKRTFLIALGVALGIAILTFVMRNPTTVSIDFLVGRISLPLWLLLVATFGAGWAIPQLLGLVRWTLVARERKRLLQRIDELEREVVELRNVPLELDVARPPVAPIASAPPTVGALPGQAGRPKLEGSARRALPKDPSGPVEVEAEIVGES
jgi:uncharacterized integral membrane protein